LEEILTHNFFRYRSWFEAFLYLIIRDGGGVALREQYLNIGLKLLLGTTLTACTCKLQLFVWVPFESKLLAHYNCCWWPLWK